MGIYFGENKKFDSLSKWASLLHRQYQTYLNKELKPFGLNSSDIQYIITLYLNEGSMCQDEIAHELIIDKAAVARSIKNLEKKDFIYREKDEDNNRKNKVIITEKSKNILTEIFEILDKWDEMLKKTVGQDEYDHVVEQMHIMSMSVIK